MLEKAIHLLGLLNAIRSHDAVAGYGVIWGFFHCQREHWLKVDLFDATPLIAIACIPTIRRHEAYECIPRPFRITSNSVASRLAEDDRGGD